jgi:hypothetical protein
MSVLSLMTAMPLGLVVQLSPCIVVDGDDVHVHDVPVACSVFNALGGCVVQYVCDVQDVMHVMHVMWQPVGTQRSLGHPQRHRVVRVHLKGYRDVFDAFDNSNVHYVVECLGLYVVFIVADLNLAPLG